LKVALKLLQEKKWADWGKKCKSRDLKLCQSFRQDIKILELQDIAIYA